MGEFLLVLMFLIVLFMYLKSLVTTRRIFDPFRKRDDDEDGGFKIDDDPDPIVPVDSFVEEEEDILV